MLHQDLVELINSGKAWAFLGSGVSVDSGKPSWGKLLDLTLADLDPEVRERLESSRSFQRSLSEGDFPTCFELVEGVAGRDVVEESVTKEMKKESSPGSVLQLLADWPFEGIVTSNYDSLIETSLSDIGEIGWVPIGNEVEDIRKVSGDAKQIVWHIHGSVHLPADRSHLVITQSDYDDVYLEDGPIVNQLRGLLAHRRLVFIGFGFRDRELMRLLKRVGAMSDPTRPIFAFLHDSEGDGDESTYQSLLEKHNVETIPYAIVGDSHHLLLERLKFYGSFCLRRSLTFGKPSRACPSYAPMTTGLRIFNTLSLRRESHAPDQVFDSLVRSRVLTLAARGTTVEELLNDLEARAGLLLGRQGDPEQMKGAVDVVLRNLREEGFISIEDKVQLTDTGRDLTGEDAANADRGEEQFSKSLLDRATKNTEEAEAAARVAKCAETFLKECVKKRALGLAMAWAVGRKEQRDFQIVALLQSLPEFMDELASENEAICLSRLVQDLLRSPSSIESSYLGAAMQAQFGVSLLGMDPAALEQRARALKETFFLIDANVLIPFLARASVEHDPSKQLIEMLHDQDSGVGSTLLLAEEVAEHARWAINKVASPSGEPSIETYEAVSGRAGQASNAFLEGFVTETGSGEIQPDLFPYLSDVLGIPRGRKPQAEDVAETLNRRGVACRSFDEWGDFKEEYWHERDTVQEEIGKKRRARESYKHERQVQAEAEALVVIRHMRRSELSLDERTFENAFFISNTRAIDEVELIGGGDPITMRAQAVLHWLITVSPVPPDELGILFTSILGELSRHSSSVISENVLMSAFGGLVSASRESLEEEMLTHRSLLATMYGEERALAFAKVPDLDVPVVATSVLKQRLDQLQEELKDERKLRATAEKGKKLSDDERNMLAKLKLEKKNRYEKSQKNRRRAQSKPKRRRKRR